MYVCVRFDMHAFCHSPNTAMYTLHASGFTDIFIYVHQYQSTINQHVRLFAETVRFAEATLKRVWNKCVGCNHMIFNSCLLFRNMPLEDEVAFVRAPLVSTLKIDVYFQVKLQ